MMYVKINTERVYSHGTDGMPKIEKIVQTIEDGFPFQKFLKYLPFQGYINNKLKILRVFDSEKDYDVAKWQQMLDEVVNKMAVPEKTIDEKYEDEKQRNDELMERLAALEAKLNPVTEPEFEEEPENEPENVNPAEPTEAQLRKEYEKKFKKKAHHLWSVETIKSKLKD